MAYRIAVDIGGTFTDGVIEAIDTGTIWVAKRLTTPADPGEAVSQVVEDLLSAPPRTAGSRHPLLVEEVIHGSTLVTNSLIERKGVDTALIVTRGTADVIDIGREVRYDLYDLDIQLPTPLVPRERRFEIDERVAADGSIIVPINAGSLRALVESVCGCGATSVAIAFLHSYVNPGNEIAVGEALRKAAPNLSITLSSRVAREIREYERTTTATANAYVQPIVESYLRALEARLKAAAISGNLRIMVSSGGFTSAETAAELPITTLESGPAGGVLSAANAGRVAGFDDVLAFDMGGTTAKLCTVTGGAPAVVHTFEAARVRRFKKGSGLPLLVPSIDLIEIGAGGGSIARISDLGLLTVGPESAGAEPGPACYGRGGTEPTVTDADLVLGYLNPDHFLGGRMKLDLGAAIRALEKLGRRLDLSTVDVANGIYNVVNEAMAGAARVHVAEKAQDPRNLTLVATGGAGPVHAVEIARKLNVKRVLFPIAAGAGSCLGFLAAPARVDRAWSKPTRLDAASWSEIDRALTEMRRDAETELRGTQTAVAEVDWDILVEMRYAGQGANVNVEFPFRRLESTFQPEMEALFAKKYQESYGGLLPTGIIEVITWRIIGKSRRDARHFTRSEHPTSDRTSLKTHRQVLRSDLGKMVEAPVYERYAVPRGTRLRGPLILEEEESTIVVAVAADVEFLENSSVVVHLQS